jgi:hypothetical protein
MIAVLVAVCVNVTVMLIVCDRQSADDSLNNGGCLDGCVMAGWKPAHHHGVQRPLVLSRYLLFD